MAHNKEVAMYRAIFSMIFVAMLTTPSMASAKPSTQMIAWTSASAPIGREFTVDMFGSVFVTPGQDPLTFYYLGFGRSLTSWWTASLRTGAVVNIPEADASPLVSVWNTLRFDEKDSLFLETEIYLLSGGGVDYYGFYGFDHAVGVWLLGVQAEQYNASMIAGPHVGINMGDHASTTVQYFAKPGWSAVRMSFGISI
ncbi:hypothetical protein L6260_00215 [Candidatus Parcubacteria bacterium]|nr:hypothetical protein [Patescibacteria group bacterium]MCG2687216.1 hypothetical protein [Candidatus Parcubacteria bacterium]